MSADLYTHGCMQSISKPFVFSVRGISKKEFGVLYHDSGSNFTTNTELALCEVPWGKREQSPHPAGTFRLAPLPQLSVPRPVCLMPAHMESPQHMVASGGLLPV